MVEGEQNPPAPKSKGPSTLTPLAPQQTERVVRDLESKGATLFDWDQFQQLTKDLPPNISVAAVLRSLKRKK